MSKVFDALRVAQRAREDNGSQEPIPKPENVIPLGHANARYWAPDTIAPRRASSDRAYISAIIILVAALISLGMYVLMPQNKIGGEGNNLVSNRDDVELAIKNKLQATSSSSPTDPVNLPSSPFEPVSDLADKPQSGEEGSRSPADGPQASTNGLPLQVQNPVPATLPVPVPTPVDPPLQSTPAVPEKGRFIITESGRANAERNARSSTDSTNVPGSKQNLEEHFRMALFQHRNGEILKAYQEYEYVLEHDPYNIDARNNLGLIFQEIGKHEDALREFGKVLAMDARNVQAINNSGVTFFKMGDYTAAVRRFEAALEIEPNNTDSYANLGLVYTQLDRVADAKAVFLKVLAMNPKHAETHYNLACLYEKNGQYKDAIFYYQKFLAYSGSNYSSIVRDTEKHIDDLYQKLPPEKSG